MKRIILLILILNLLVHKTNAQGWAPVGIEIGFGKGYNVYGSATNKYFSNAFPVTPKLYFYIADFIFGFDLNDFDSPCKRELVIENNTYSTDEKLTLNFGSFIFGYKFYPKSNISVDPFFGFITSSINSLKNKDIDFSKSGICWGFIVNRYFKTKSKIFHPLVFFSNRVNYNKLGQINKDFGSYNYSFDIGLGIEFGPKMDRKVKNKKNKNGT